MSNVFANEWPVVVRASNGNVFVNVSIPDDLLIAPRGANPYLLLTPQEARDLARDIRMTLRDMAVDR